MKKFILHCENTDFAKNAQFWFLILPFFTLKMRISKNRSIFLFPHLPTTHKPKIVMIHQEMLILMGYVSFIALSINYAFDVNYAFDHVRNDSSNL